MQKIQVIGRAGGDAVVFRTPSGNKGVNVNIAVNEMRGDQEITTWFRVTAWGNFGEKVVALVKKGSYVYVEGRPSAQAWVDDNGEVHVREGVTASYMKFL